MFGEGLQTEPSRERSGDRPELKAVTLLHEEDAVMGVVCA